MEVPLYGVKVQVPRPRVTWGQVRWKMWNWYNLKSQSPITTKLHSYRYNIWTFTSVSGWGLAQLRFLSYISASFYDIGVPWKFMCLLLGSDRTYAAQTLWGSEDWSNFVWELFFSELSWYWSSGEFGKFICPAGLFSEVASARCPKSVHGWARLGSA